jgi:hypothetical protein
MRLAFDQWPACAVRLSNAAAMVICDTCQKSFTIFGLTGPSQGIVNKG